MEVDVYMHKGCPACELQKEELRGVEIDVDEHWLSEERSTFRDRGIEATPTLDVTCDENIQFSHRGVLTADEIEEFC
jgi:hypothetical protein